MADPTVPVIRDEPPATTPAKNWFARLDPAWRALIVFALSTAVSIIWNKYLPGVPLPPVPVPQTQSVPAVLVLNVGQPVQPQTVSVSEKK